MQRWRSEQMTIASTLIGAGAIGDSHLEGIITLEASRHRLSLTDDRQPHCSGQSDMKL